MNKAFIKPSISIILKASLLPYTYIALHTNYTKSRNKSYYPIPLNLITRAFFHEMNDGAYACDDGTRNRALDRALDRA